jgi:hypothetical protein
MEDTIMRLAEIENAGIIHGEDLGQIAPGVKIAFPVSHNTLTIAEEYIQ